MELLEGSLVKISRKEDYGMCDGLVRWNGYIGKFIGFTDPTCKIAIINFPKPSPDKLIGDSALIMSEHLSLVQDEPTINDNVNHPKHYTSSGIKCASCDHNIECIEVSRHFGFNLGNVIKYVWRANHKNGIEDLRKAAWYLNDYIKRLESTDGK